MEIEPDTKDWTWVLGERCAACGVDAGSIDPRTTGDRVRSTLPRWEDVLGRVDAKERPAAAIWSPTEYACHVRDVFTLFAERARLMLSEDAPVFGNWDQDETAIERGYAHQDPAVVSRELVASGLAAAATFDGVAEDAWERTGMRSNGSGFTVATLAQYFLHDVLHHLHDVRG